MNNDIQFAVGKLTASIEALAEKSDKHHDDQRADIKQIFEKLDSISAHGCAFGQRNAKDIEELKRRPEKIVGIGAAAVAILSAVWATLKAHFER